MWDDKTILCCDCPVIIINYLHLVLYALFYNYWIYLIRIKHPEELPGAQYDL